jgi:hypothetical protein
MEQAEQTRRLAELVSAAEPDDAAIAECLDRLAMIGRSIQGLVVETILTQRATLPAAERALFCTTIHQRLCEPWAGTCARPEKEKTRTKPEGEEQP